MAVLKVVNYGNPILRKVCEPVRDFAKLNAIIADMFDSMYEAEGIGLDVLRPEKVKLRYQTLDEQWHEDEFEGLLARAIQHEMDHLNGVFIVDRVSEIERIQYQKDLKELERKSKSLISSDLNQKGFVL